LLVGIVTRASAAPHQALPESGASDETDAGGPGAPEEIIERSYDPEIAVQITPPIPVQQIVAAAYRAAGIAEDPSASWAIRTRLVGLVPQVSFHLGRGQTWRGIEDPTLGYREGWDVRATWHIDRLLFDANEMRIATLDIDRRRERRRVAGLAIHTYFRWVVADEAAKRASRDAPRWKARRDQLLAELDVLTEGWASAMLSRHSIRDRTAPQP